MTCPHNKDEDLGDGDHQVDLMVSRVEHYHYAREVLQTEKAVEQRVHAAVAATKQLVFGRTAGDRYGLKTNKNDGFNTRFRTNLIGKHSGFLSEVAWSTELPEPLWLFAQPKLTKVGGFKATDRFDFARLDQCRNAQKLWNIIASGAVRDEADRALLFEYSSRLVRAHWDGPTSPKASCSCVYDRVKTAASSPALPKTLTDDPLEHYIENSDPLPRIQVQEPEHSLILGEVQLGNWALAYRDVGRLLAVRGTFRDTPINLFVVVVLDGCLSKHISTGTVNFENTRSVYERLGPDVPIPTWVVGVDFDHAAGAKKHPRASRD